MNQTIKELNVKLEYAETSAEDIRAQLQSEWNTVLTNNLALESVISRLKDSNDYRLDSFGDIVSWIGFDANDFKDCREFFKEYLRESHYVEVDFENDCLTMSHGDDSLIIQNDTRLDNGVWQGNRLIIKESLYKNDDGEVNETLRNKLIEEHMEKTGYFPGVFRIDYHGNVFSVKTTV